MTFRWCFLLVALLLLGSGWAQPNTHNLVNYADQHNALMNFFDAIGEYERSRGVLCDCSRIFRSMRIGCNTTTCPRFAIVAIPPHNYFRTGPTGIVGM
jgi:hypothetical protein